MRRTLPTLLVSCTAALHAQGTITDANASFTLTPFPPAGPATPQPATFSASACAPTVLFESRWLWRIAGDPDAAPFRDAGNGSFAQTWSGNTAVLTWTDVAQRGALDAQLTMTVRGTAPESGTCEHVLALTNAGAAPLALSAFLYVDVDHNGTVANDRTLPGTTADRFLVGDTDACGSCTEVWGEAPSRWQIGAFPQLILALHGAGTAADCANVGAPFGPGDFTGAMQWDLVLAPGAVRVVRAVIGHGDLHVGMPGLAFDAGPATPGASGAPTIASVGNPVLGAAHRLLLTEGSHAATSGTLLVGLGSQPPVPFCGITLHVSAAIAAVPVAMNAGAGAFDFPAICTPVFAGAGVHTQLFVVDASGPCATIPLIASALHTHVYGD